MPVVAVHEEGQLSGALSGVEIGAGKRFRAIATRVDKTALNFLAATSPQPSFGSIDDRR
jgi:hypothetical protein